MFDINVIQTKKMKTRLTFLRKLFIIFSITYKIIKTLKHNYKIFFNQSILLFKKDRFVFCNSNILLIQLLIYPLDLLQFIFKRTQRFDDAFKTFFYSDDKSLSFIKNIFLSHILLYQQNRMRHKNVFLIFETKKLY